VRKDARRWHSGDQQDGTDLPHQRFLDTLLSLIRGEIFNLGDGRMNHQLSEVAEKILVAFPKTKVEHKENPDRRNYRVSFEKINGRLGFKCSLSLNHGIQELCRAFEEGQVLDYRAPKYYNLESLRLSGSPSCKDELDERVMAAFAQAPTANRKCVRLVAQAAGVGR
jgi:hypothetical protein